MAHPTARSADHEQHVAEALAVMDLPAKVALLAGDTPWTLPANPDIGLDALRMSDGPAGVRGERWSPEDTAVQLPCPSALAATWDPEQARTAGLLLAQEARRKGAHVLLAPTVNLHRSPRAGRHFECYSEDPLLTGDIGAGFVGGVQEGGVAATLKHFVANDSETERFTVDVQVTERTLREVYLAPFERIVAGARPWMLMSAYNRVNSTTMTEHARLNAVLRDEWGFDGAIVSDWHAARDTVADARAGMDIAMPGPGTVYGEHLIAAVRDGRVGEAQVDAMARRVLLLAARTGALRDVPPAAPTPSPVDGHAIAHELACRSTVLLRNHAAPGESPLLPLNPKALRRVAVLGAAAADPRTGGGGSARVFPPYRISPLRGLRDALPREVQVDYAVGADPVTSVPTLQGPVRGELYDHEGGLVSQTELAEASSYDMDRLTGDADVADVRAVEVSGTVELAEPGEHVFEIRGTGRFTLTVAGLRRYSGTLELEDPEAPGAVMFSPARQRVALQLDPGQVEFSLIKSDVDPQNLEFALFSLGYRAPAAAPEAELAAAEEAAAGADVAIVVVGTTDEVESEGFDRGSLALPGRQDALVERVAAVNPRTVVVVNSGAPVLMPWRDSVAAVMVSWFGGQEMGAAVADVLLGRAEPAGRLPTTWPAGELDAPVLSTQPEGGVLRYGEGVFIGYRAWQREGREPAWWFGHGLSYTTWRYDGLEVLPGRAPTELARVRVAVTNAGGRAGREVVQVYLAAPPAAGAVDPAPPERPPQWLVGFAGVGASPGQQATPEIVIDRRAAEVWHDGRWQLPGGSYRILVGASAVDIRLESELTAP